MRRIVYIHQLRNWPSFTWNQEGLAARLAGVRHLQGRLVGRMMALGFDLRGEANLRTLTQEVVKSGEIEGLKLDPGQVRSSIARRLGMDLAGLVPADRHVEGVVELMLDATQKFSEELTARRLFNWHAAMFPTGTSGMQRIRVGAWRNNTRDDPMQVVSGAMGKERIHFEAPDSEKLPQEMKAFLKWFNHTDDTDPVVKAAVAHLWFVTIHPFDDGNGRIARAITDMQLARSDESAQRFYSLSTRIRQERNDYYDILEKIQKGTLDITHWLEWFLDCLDHSLRSTEGVLTNVLLKARFREVHSGKQFNPRQQTMLNKLFDHFDGKLTSSKWAKMTKCSQDTALRDIQDLLDRKILARDAAGGRSSGYLLNTKAF
jgi:Fic family protein